MQEYEPSPLWRRVLNACLAGLSSIVGMDMALAWGWHFLLDREGHLPSGAPPSPGMVNATTVILYGIGIILSVVLARWQWKRSLKSTQMHETLMTGAWLLLSILMLTRPRFS